MTWSKRMKLAWKTFKREALPLYGWTVIFFGVIVMLIIAMTLGFMGQMRLAFPNIHNFEGAYSYSSGMPVPGIPPSYDISPFNEPFSSPDQDPFAYFGGIHSFSRLLPLIGNIAGAFFLILVVLWLVGSAFYTGIFNLTAKAYCKKVSFKDFHFAGFLRILGWQAFLLLIQLLLLVSGVIGAYALRNSEGILISFLIAYTLLILVIVLYILPWLVSSGIYLLAHREATFYNGIVGSWKFFRKHMGTLWGYIGTVILIQVAIEILSRISSQGLADIALLVIIPFEAVLGIVWVLSLKDDDSYYFATAISEPQTALAAPPFTNSPEIKAYSDPVEPKINLQKPKPLPPFPEDNSPHCPSCGKSDTGTVYCPQCGTKLR